MCRSLMGKSTATIFHFQLRRILAATPSRKNLLARLRATRSSSGAKVVKANQLSSWPSGLQTDLSREVTSKIRYRRLFIEAKNNLEPGPLGGAIAKFRELSTG